MKLKGKVAIVTGSGRGIGEAIALAMARDGAAVVVNDVDAGVADEVVQKIRGIGARAESCVAAVGTKSAAEALVDTALTKLGGLHIVVNNAGIARDNLLHKMTEEQWDEVITVHLKGTFLNTQAALQHMMPNRYGKIINVTSVAGTRGHVGLSNYAAAKMGILGLTLTLAKELARYHINVNALSPGAVTRMSMSMPERLRQVMLDQMARENVLQRPGLPEDVAPSAVFLASDEARYLTGQVIACNGFPMTVL